jgi:hypothetical protein
MVLFVPTRYFDVMLELELMQGFLIIANSRRNLRSFGFGRKRVCYSSSVQLLQVLMQMDSCYSSPLKLVSFCSNTHCCLLLTLYYSYNFFGPLRGRHTQNVIFPFHIGILHGASQQGHELSQMLVFFPFQSSHLYWETWRRQRVDYLLFSELQNF